MKPLSKEATAALNALSSADPTRADEARVRKNLERALGVAIPAASVAVVTTAVSAQAATGAGVSGGLGALGVGAKAVVFVLAVGVGSAVTVGITQSLTRGSQSGGVSPSRVVAPPTRPSPPPAPEEIEVTVEDEPSAPLAMKAEAIEAAPTPKELATPAPVRTRPEAVTARPSTPMVMTGTEKVEDAPVDEEFTAPPAPPNTQESYELEVDTNFPNCDSGTELRSAVSARKLLKASRAEEALWLLSAYQKRCPSGRWSDEAWSVRMAGLCKLGRNAEVIGLLQWFSTEYPSRRFVVVNELRSSCPEAVLKHGEPSAE